MITFSKREDYGMMLMTELFQNFGKKLVPLSEIAQKHTISLFFLRNIASDLRKAGFIKAAEGKNGGYTFSTNPKNIQFGKIIEVLARRPLFSCCQNTADGKCHVNLCPHGFSPRRLTNQFLEGIYDKSLSEVVSHAYHKKS